MKKYWFIFCKDSLMLEKLSDGTYTIPLCEELPIENNAWITPHHISPMPDGTEVYTLRIDAPVTDKSWYEMCGLRKSYYKLSRQLYLKAGKCQEILYWDESTKFCGVCGAPMKMHTDISKRCVNCGKEIWPQLATAIIVLINKDDEVLLVHANNFKGNFYGLVAGFVETGETLEEAVYREVMEETGIKIKNLNYYASQSWPYPCGLMVGFYAEYESGEIHLQSSELGDGKWFHHNKLPVIPEKLSIARRLIDHWIEGFPDHISTDAKEQNVTMFQNVLKKTCK